jgi:biotin-dependent carboxylase-like uncharacterized protein
MAIEVIKPGLATSVQDSGRPGYYNLGIPLSGALDQYALRLANLLVGNDEGAAALEVALLGPELAFQKPAIIAVAGGEAAPKINGAARPRNESFSVQAGDRLSFDYMKLGARLYIAVAGGINVPEVLGSRSTYALGALGGFAGRKLAPGDVVPVGAAPRSARAGRTVPRDLVPSYPKSLEIRVLPGLYFHRLADESAATFFEDTWTVAPEADRIGYRFRKGRALVFRERRQPRRCRISLRLDPGAGRRRADYLASRCSFRRRLRHDRHGDQRRHGPDRTDAAQQPGALRARRHGDGAQGACRLQGAAVAVAGGSV